MIIFFKEHYLNQNFKLFDRFAYLEMKKNINNLFFYNNIKKFILKLPY